MRCLTIKYTPPLIPLEFLISYDQLAHTLGDKRFDQLFNIIGFILDLVPCSCHTHLPASFTLRCLTRFHPLLVAMAIIPDALMLYSQTRNNSHPYIMLVSF